MRVLGPELRGRLPVRALLPHLAAAHDVGVLRQQIHHLPLAFIAPLRAEHHCHPVGYLSRSVPWAATRMLLGKEECRWLVRKRHGLRRHEESLKGTREA